jgi:ferric-dicitrate binding protein FerR (iron transport regulator)
MSPEELHRLVEAYRDGSISMDDARRLAAAARADGAAVRREMAFLGHLGQALEAADDAAFVRSFTERISAERGGDEFMTAFRKRTSAISRTRRVRQQQRSSVVPYLVAAGFLFAILAAVVWQKNQIPAPVALVKETLPSPPTPTPEPKIETPIAPAPTPKPPVPAPDAPKPTPPPVAAPESPVRPPEPPPTVTPHEEPKTAPVKPTEVTRTAVTRLDRVEGDVFVIVDGDRKAGAAGQEIVAGMSIATGGKSAAAIVLPDGTRITIGADASIRDVARGPKGTRIFVTLGTVTADVARQPADQPLTFVSPHGEAKVVGTVLRLVVDAASTRVEVKEGKVQLTREGKSVIVSAGQFAVAAAGQPLSSRSMSADEILLLPSQAKLTGAEWSLKPDIRSMFAGQQVLEGGPTTFKVVDHVETRPSYATFTFYASADKEYRIWMRLTSQEKGDPWNRDMVTIEPLRSIMSQKSPFFGAAPTTAWVVTGVSATPGFTWISGHGDLEKAAEPPLVVRFQETGFQNIRLYVGHPWVRVDAVWLSATQKTRPNPRFTPIPTDK